MKTSILEVERQTAADNFRSLSSRKFLFHDKLWQGDFYKAQLRNCISYCLCSLSTCTADANRFSLSAMLQRIDARALPSVYVPFEKEVEGIPSPVTLKLFILLLVLIQESLCVLRCISA